jgi:hypothetical protein
VKIILKSILLVLIFSSSLFAGEKEIVSLQLEKLKVDYTWVESYKLNSWDCSTQSTTLWYILKEKGIKSKIAASLYYEKGVEKDHIFLIAELDGKMQIIDATWLEIRDPNPLKYGFYIVRIYDSPKEANKVWPGEYVRWNIYPMKRTKGK